MSYRLIKNMPSCREPTIVSSDLGVEEVPNYRGAYCPSDIRDGME